MAIAYTKFNNSFELEQFLNDEMERTGWKEMIGIDDRTREHCLECAGIKFVSWNTNEVVHSVFAPEFDY